MRELVSLLGVFATGLVFALGLGLAGMTNADKVIGFLTFLGPWDPSLGLVMAGAIAAHLATWRLVTGRAKPVFADVFRIPDRTDVDRPLLVGAALFGVGWGLGGYCPGPGLVSAVSASAAPLVFVASMVLGMAVFHGLQRVSTRARPSGQSGLAQPEVV
ncbi:MAG: YeeE/YedE family protein [Myxococcales bacterium]|nr:YeeE/YedE family protein [Myxococcales bacterium]